MRFRFWLSMIVSGLGILEVLILLSSCAPQSRVSVEQLPLHVRSETFEASAPRVFYSAAFVLSKTGEDVIWKNFDDGIVVFRPKSAQERERPHNSNSIEPFNLWSGEIVDTAAGPISLHSPLPSLDSPLPGDDQTDMVDILNEHKQALMLRFEYREEACTYVVLEAVKKSGHLLQEPSRSTRWIQDRPGIEVSEDAIRDLFLRIRQAIRDHPEMGVDQEIGGNPEASDEH